MNTSNDEKALDALMAACLHPFDLTRPINAEDIARAINSSDISLSADDDKSLSLAQKHIFDRLSNDSSSMVSNYCEHVNEDMLVAMNRKDENNISDSITEEEIQKKRSEIIKKLKADNSSSESKDD